MATKSVTIADLHLDHGPGILKIRPQFKTVEEHDKFVIDELNRTANKHDTLLLLGDIGIGAKSYGMLKTLNCQNVILVPGNHCGERSPIDSSAFKYMMGAYTRYLPHSKIKAVFTHIPVHPSCLDRWHVNIHGHLHDQVVDDPRYFCVSAEQLHFKPIDMESIYFHFRLRKIEGLLDCIPEGLFSK